MTKKLVVVAVLLWGGLVSAEDKVDPKLVGDWRAEPIPGLQMGLKINANGSCVFDDEPARCTAKNGTFTMSSEEDGNESYKYSLQGNVMTLTGGDLEWPIQFKRVGGGKSAPVAAADDEASPAPVARGKGKPEPEPELEAPVKPSGPGQAFEKEAWGVKFTAPAGWKIGEKSGLLLLGHDTEAGLMIVRFYPKASREEAAQQLSQPIQDSGLTLSPSGQPQDYKGKGLFNEFTGTSPQGEQLKGRVVALFNGHGGALGVMALTSAEKYPALKARLDQLVGTVTFKKPKQVKAQHLVGNYWFYVGSNTGGTYSRETKLNLCRSGQFNRGGEMYGSGSAGTAFVNSGSGGTWSADGNEYEGTVTLQYGSGEVETLNYRVSQNPKDRSAHGPAVFFGNQLYQRTGSGDCG